MFDVMSTTEIAAIAAMNAPEATKATPAFIRELRSKAMSEGRQQAPVYVTLDRPSLEELFGIRACKEGEIPSYTTGKGDSKESWVEDWNKGNRAVIESNLAKIFKSMIQGKFVTTPETWIFLDNGQCGSAQHRGKSAHKVMVEVDPSFTVTVLLSFGFSSQLADVLDRAAKRTNAAISARNNIIDETHFLDENGTPLVGDIHGAVATCNRELNSMLKLVALRGTGRDVKASGEFDQAGFGDMLQRCPEAPQLMVDIYLGGKLVDGKDSALIKQFGRPLVGAMLILSANTDNPSEWEASESGRTREWTLPATIAMPTPETVAGFLEVGGGNQASDPFGAVYAKLSNSNFKKHPQRKAGILNALLRHYLSSRSVVEVPPAIDAKTGQPLPGATSTTQYSCDHVPFEACDPGVPQTKKDDGSTPPPYKWFNFGGLDCGYLPPLSK